MIKRIIGDPSEFPIEHRILNGAFVVSSLLVIAIMVNNLVLGLNPVLNLIIGCACALFLFLLYLSRVRKMYSIPLWALALFFIGALPFSWFLNSGLFGSTIYICFVMLAVILVIARGRMRLLFAGIFIMEILALIMLEYWRPDLVVHYENREMQFIDIIINLAASLVMMMVLIIIVMKNYEEEKKKAEESSRLKSYFLANISHEIRTPMNSILGFSELLLDEELTDRDRKHHVDIIRRSGGQLLNLIDDLIDVSRIEAGELKIREKTFNLDAMMGELYDIFAMQMQKTGHTASLVRDRPPAGEAGTVVSDENRLRQVLMNLIGNAVKYTEKGTIRFGYERVDEGRVRFFISDNGVGIDPENLPRIFDQFMQVDGTMSRRYGGAGLGLSISKKLVELMGGRIEAQSEPGKGSRFVFDIPCRSVSGDTVTAPEPAKKKEKNGSWKGRTVLIVEDNDDSFRLLERILTKHGITVMRAGNGRDAVDLCAARTDINLVLMDIQLPGMSGYDAARRIRAYRSDLPIVAQSGNAFDSDREASIQAGCNEFIAKPIIIGDLLKVLERYL